MSSVSPVSISYKKPNAAGGSAGWSRPDKFFYCRFGRGLKHAFNDEKINVLMPQCEGEVIGQVFSWPVALVEKAPRRVTPLAATDVFFRHHARPADRRLDG